MKFEGISFNAEHLAKMPKKQFIKEVAHHLSKEKADELYSIITGKNDNSKPAQEPNESGHGQGDNGGI